MIVVRKSLWLTVLRLIKPNFMINCFRQESCITKGYKINIIRLWWRWNNISYSSYSKFGENKLQGFIFFHVLAIIIKNIFLIYRFMCSIITRWNHQSHFWASTSFRAMLGCFWRATYNNFSGRGCKKLSFVQTFSTLSKLHYSFHISWTVSLWNSSLLYL